MLNPSYNIRLVVFDFDGTLADSQQAITQTMSQAFRNAGFLAPTAASIRRVVGLSLDEAVAVLAAGQSEEITQAEQQSIAAQYRAGFLALRTAPDYEEDLFPGALECLKELSGRHAFLGIATGKALRGLKAALALHGIDHLFTTLQTADHAPSKPHPEMLNRAMREVGVGPGETLMIGDTVYDIEMAGKAEVRSIGVAWGYHEPEELKAAGAIALAETFEALPALIQQLDGGS